jgi:hypothetical protein
MSVVDFLTKAEALKAKGMIAMFSGDADVVRSEIKSAAIAYRSDVAAGKPPRSFPPPKGSVKLDSDELIANFRTIPAQRQATMSVRATFVRVRTH